MGNFKKGGFRKEHGNSSGRPKFGGKFEGGRDGGDRSRKPLQLFSAVCADCKKNCQVPFRPAGDKPVYCRDCFGKQRHVPGRNSNGADGPRADFQRDAVPQRVYQSEYARPQNNEGVDALKRQLDLLESKVNRILELVSAKPDTQAFVAPMTKIVPQTLKVAKEKTLAHKAIPKGKK
ncbi:MAG: CxxC-x17-CxxC domain-containing protein [Patescibacteria group bacterium]